MFSFSYDQSISKNTNIQFNITSTLLTYNVTAKIGLGRLEMDEQQPIIQSLCCS